MLVQRLDRRFLIAGPKDVDQLQMPPRNIDGRERVGLVNLFEVAAEPPALLAFKPSPTGAAEAALKSPASPS